MRPRDIFFLLFATVALVAPTGSAHAAAIQPRLVDRWTLAGFQGTPVGLPQTDASTSDPLVLSTAATLEPWRVQLLVAEEMTTEPERSGLLRSLRELGAEPKGEAWRSEPRIWEIEVPPANLLELAQLPGVVHVGELLGPRLLPGEESMPGSGSAADRSNGPFRPDAMGALPNPAVGAVESEALAGMRVPEAHDLGYRGQGIRVGIVDVGFDSYLERVGTELPAKVRYRNFTDSAPSTQSHGTACAEVIADIVPEAEFYLAEISSSVQLQEAIDWMLQQQVEVVSHSLAWFLGGGDGSGPIVDMTRAAADQGLHWVTSSGNFRRAFWRGEARNEDGDPYIDTASGNAVRISSGTSTSTIDLVLAWDRWPLSESVSFQIDIYDGDSLLGTSAAEFGDDYPYAFREITIPSAGHVAPEFRIRNDRGDPAGVKLRLFRVDGGSLEAGDRIESGSLAIPGDSPWVLSVGAYSYRAVAPEQFSSYGPSGAGLLKPDLIAADAISTSLPRYTRFVGTSAACPHVAGAVALLLSAQVEGGAFDLHWSRDDIASLLRTSAEPFFDVATDEQGWGRIRIPLGRSNLAVSSLRLAGSSPGRLLFHLAAADPSTAGPLAVYDAAGRRVGAIAPRATRTNSETLGEDSVNDTQAGTRPSPGVDYEITRSDRFLVTGRYWARDPRSGATAPFVWVR